MAKEVRIDTEACVGCGLCEMTCPDVFYLGGDGIAQVKGSPNLFNPDLQQAADECPVDAISIKEGS